MTWPDFIIGGAQKSGTTTLIEVLRRHPQVYSPDHEMHFFSSKKDDPMGNWERGVEWYKEQFPDDGRVTGEKTPNYLYNPSSPQRIYEHIPDVKLIFILRDPVKRAYSQYWMRYRNRGYVERGTFREAVRRPDCEYIERGVYWKQLKRYRELFSDDQIKVFILKELKETPRVVFGRIYDFIGVDTVFPEGTEKRFYRGGQPRFHWLGVVRHGVTHAASQTQSWLLTTLLRQMAYGINLVNVKGQFAEYISGKKHKGYPPMDDDVKQYLYGIFSPHNDKLREMYPDLPISHWYDPIQ